jgi:hypothetical protein
LRMLVGNIYEFLEYEHVRQTLASQIGLWQ